MELLQVLLDNSVYLGRVIFSPTNHTHFRLEIIITVLDIHKIQAQLIMNEWLMNMTFSHTIIIIRSLFGLNIHSTSEVH